jgi:hypothetical protein
VNATSRPFLFTCIPLLLAGCVASSEQLSTVYASQRAPTTGERQQIIAHIRNTFFDPYSVRDAEISNALPFAVIGSSNASVVCIHANSKNRLGGYVGRQYTMTKFDAAGKLTNADDSSVAKRECSDARLTYRAFPEAEALR